MAVEMKQLPLPIAPPPASGFDHLVVGGNAAAVQHLHGLCTATGAQPPVYLWGDAGTGKTHLMRALVAQRQADGDQRQVKPLAPQARRPSTYHRQKLDVLAEV